MIVTNENAHEVLLDLRKYYKEWFECGDNDEDFLAWIHIWLVARQEEIKEALNERI